MEKVKTGIYKTKTIRDKEELILSRNSLEEIIKSLIQSIKGRENNPRYKTNVERLERVVKTAQMFIRGYKIQSIALELNLKYSTVLEYAKFLNSEYNKL